MSDSESSTSLPSESRIEATLRKVVSTGNLEELTLKRVRKAAEQELGLPEDFFKTSLEWKDRSKTIVTAEVEKRETASQETPSSPPSKQKRVSKAAGKSTSQKPAQTTAVKAAARGGKRASPAPKSRPQKRRKVVASSESELDDGDDASDSKEKKPAEDIEDNGKNTTHENLKSPVRTAQSANAQIAIAESDLSDVIDEPVVRRKRQKNAGTEKKPKRETKPKSKAVKGKADLDPQEAEIKKLQGWLVKCGIRKMWFKELQPYETPKAKINHLKLMLKDAGMDGRFSIEKANQIKERRELAADLEAVQEGEKAWGKGASDDESEQEDEGRSRRKLARGFKSLAFLSSGGEETD